MTPGPTPPPEPTALRVPILCAWLLMPVTISLPGRSSIPGDTGLDLIVLAKLLVRGGVSVVLLREIARAWAHPRRPTVAWCLTPFALFLGWGLVTAAWSPLKVVSVGQWGSVVAQVLLAAAIALRWSGPRDTEALVRHLCLALTTIALLVLGVYAVSRDLSGLNREEVYDEVSTGLVHPTSAGATASLGLLLVIAGRVLWGWRWARVMLVPAGAAGLALLLAAHSRMATAMTAVVLGLAVVGYATPAARARGLVAAAALLAAYLAADPGLRAVDAVNRAVAEYAQRGESDETVSSLNGRNDLWEVVWAEFWHAPVHGHGYFLITRTGYIDVWHGASMLTAHNVVLQVLVSTGVIGLGLFAWALARPARAAAAGLAGGGEPGRVRGLLVLAVVWYAGWGQLCESFAGPLSPETVVFYSLLGLAVAHARRPPAAPGAAP